MAYLRQLDRPYKKDVYNIYFINRLQMQQRESHSLILIQSSFIYNLTLTLNYKVEISLKSLLDLAV